MSISVMNKSVLSVPTEAELTSYKIIIQAVIGNPHWRKKLGHVDEPTAISVGLSIVLLGRELGISPILALSGGINVINGCFEISARIMNGLLRKAGIQMRVKICSETLCTIWGKRPDTGEEMEVTYHIDEARIAGLIRPGSGWTKNPSDMVFARCLSRFARRIGPDIIGGCYGEGELQETVLKQPVESIELPPKEEIEIEPLPSLDLDLPEGYDLESVEDYVQECAANYKMSADYLRKRAQENLPGFLAKYRDWLEKNKQPVDASFDTEELEKIEA